MTKIRDVVIYEDKRFYSAFPSIVRRENGDLLVAFRRAPERRLYGGKWTHADPNSQLVLVRSFDNGATWTKEPELIHAHAMGGSQDPCMTILSDGTILCASYLWVLLQPESPGGGTYGCGWRFTFAGGYLMRSTDGAKSWQGPIVPPPVPGSDNRDYSGKPLPMYNRGAILQGSDGLLYWAVVRSEKSPGKGLAGVASVHLAVSGDRGSTWEYRCPIAVDSKTVFNETSLYETPKGDIMAFIRTDAGFDDHTVVARSRNRGRSFEPWQDAGFQGHPHHASRLPDGRAFLVYGFRHEPYGIRARVLNPECTELAKAPEIILRDDGGMRDVGYPWSVVLPDGHVLAVYYFNRADDTRFIAGTGLGPDGD